MGVLMDLSQVGRHCETKSDSTLNNMKKADLISYIRMLEHNYNVAVDFNIQQVKNFQLIEDKVVKELRESAILMSTESSPHKYFKAVGVNKAVDIVRMRGVHYGE